MESLTNINAYVGESTKNIQIIFFKELQFFYF
jgi:hypothetical protein